MLSATHFFHDQKRQQPVQIRFSTSRRPRGTDAPVEDVSPIASYYATVSRMMPNGERFYADQAMSRIEALESYTINVAYSGFEEDIKGSITPGKLADFVVLSQDILTVPEDQIPDTKVLYTIVGGKVVYEAH